MKLLVIKLSERYIKEDCIERHGGAGSINTTILFSDILNKWVPFELGKRYRQYCQDKKYYDIEDRCICKAIDRPFQRKGYRFFAFHGIKSNIIYQAKHIILNPSLALLGLKSDDQFISFISESRLKGANIKFMVAPNFWPIRTGPH